MKRFLAAAILGAALGGLALSGCTPELPAPDLESAHPDWAYNGEPTEVSLVGSRFYPEVSVDLARDDARSDDDFLIELVGDAEAFELEGVELQSTTELTGFVPEGHEPGLYDVRITAPGGQVTQLEDAFSITSTRADHLALEFDVGPYAVGETAVVDLRVEDPTDTVVPVSLEVEVFFSSTSGSLVVSNAGLEDFVLLNGGVRGRLPSSGEGFVAVSSTTAGVFEVVARPADPTSSIDDSNTGQLSFEAGEVAGIEIELEEGMVTALAGEAFPVTVTPVDELGNAIHGERVVLDLGDGQCFGQVEPAQVELTGPASLQVTFFRACAATELVLHGDATGTSDTFRVDAGPVDGLRVQLDPNDPSATVVAGEEDLQLVVEAVDAFGNPVSTYNEELGWADDLGGLDTDHGVGSATCGPWALGTRSCALSLEVAGQATVLAEDQRGNFGVLDTPITVLAGVPAQMAVELVDAQHTAGQTFSMRVRVDDAFGNPAVIDPLGADPFSVDDGLAGTTCEVVGLDEEDRHELECVSTAAGPGVVYLMSLPSRGLSASSDAIGVVNGDLALVDIDVATSVVAGDTFAATLSAYDTWGNPCTQGVSSVQLADDSGSVSQTVVLDANGEGTASNLRITVAGARALTATNNNIAYGAATVDVVAAGLAALTVEPARTWAWVGEGRLVTVSGIDNYGNVVTSYVGPVTLSSDSSLFVSRSITDFSDGVAEVTVSWDDSGLGDRVEAVGPGGESGVSVLMDAVESCAGGPEASLELDDDGLTCRVSGKGSVSADFSGCTAGDESLVSYHLFDGQATSTRSTADSGTVTSSISGGFVVELIAVDGAACASSDTSGFWVNDPGQPAGPVTVTLGHSSRSAGSGPADSDTTVTVSTTDCAGDVPTATAIYARTDLGDLTGLTTASDGLTTPLSTGAASFTWSGQKSSHAGTATVHVGTVDGAAHGSASLSVTGDGARPQVAWVDPMGATDELFSSVVIGFTDDVLSSTSASAFSLTGPGGAAAFTLSIDGDEATLELSSSQDAGAGEWTLLVSDDVRDESGNRLDGGFDGAAGDFESLFGDVVDDGVTVDDCAPDTSTFTPDGADGSGVEADAIDIDAEASDTPAWWRVDVYSGDAERVATLWTEGTSDTETLSWDGRADGGAVVAEGEWTLLVSAIDEQFNVSDSCTQDVLLRQHYTGLE
jgi:hypothetical protein